MADFPRVLVLCQNNIQPFTGGGVLLSNLFHEFSSDNVLFFHRDIDYNYPSPYRSHRLGWAMLRPNLIVLIRSLFRWIFKAVRRPSQTSGRDLLAIVVQSCRFRFSRAVDLEIRQFQPEVIYAWVGDSLWAKTLEEVARRYSLPYVIHFMDNHVGMSPQSPLELTLYPMFRKNLDWVAKHAVSIYTISDSMGQAYNALWGRPYEVFHGLLDTATWPWSGGSGNADHVFTLVFTGSVEQGQLLGLLDVAEAVSHLAAEGVNLRLVLYLTEQYEKLVGQYFATFSQVEIRRHPDFSGLRSILLAADVLVLAYGFDERTIQYYRYSFATKIVPYMLSGRCILAYGPKEIEPVAYANRGGWAEIVTNTDVVHLAESIKKLIDSPHERYELAQKAYVAGREEHDLFKNSMRFARCLSLAVGGNSNG